MTHPPHRTHARGLVAGALTAASLVLGACGSSQAPTVLNTEKVESAIEQSIADQRGKVADVSCPSGVHQVDAVVFTCWATIGSHDTPFVVTQTDASGHVRYES